MNPLYATPAPAAPPTATRWAVSRWAVCPANAHVEFPPDKPRAERLRDKWERAGYQHVKVHTLKLRV